MRLLFLCKVFTEEPAEAANQLVLRAPGRERLHCTDLLQLLVEIHVKHSHAESLQQHREDEDQHADLPKSLARSLHQRHGRCRMGLLLQSESSSRLGLRWSGASVLFHLLKRSKLN